MNLRDTLLLVNSSESSQTHLLCKIFEDTFSLSVAETPDQGLMLLKENQAVKYIIVNCSNTKLAEGNIKEGDKVKIGYYTKSMNKRIENEKMYIEISAIFKEE